jgi:hypothetical protein
MFQKKVFYICVLLFIVSKVSAQVNLQTGSAVFSLPIFNWKDDKSRLNTAVALSYNSGNGLKVDEVASNVGQGWNLIAGGVITRMQVGEPDDQKPYAGDGTEHDIRRYPPGYLYATVPAHNGCPDALARYPIYGARNMVYKDHNKVSEDRQLDYFAFQFNGKAGMFILDKNIVVNGGIKTGVGIPIGDTKMKITFQLNESLPNNTHLGIRTTITSFAIQDVDGLIYRFITKGITKVLENNYCDVNLVQRTTQPKFKRNRVYHQAGFENPDFMNSYMIGSWYLDEIEDPFTHTKITFSYTLTPIHTVAGQDITYNAESEYAVISYKSSNTQVPEMTAINFPDLHSVVINRTKNREDMVGQKAITSIDVLYNGRYLSSHVLNTSYFILNRYGTPVTQHQKSVARLCLLSVQKFGPDRKEDSPPFKFDYHMGSSTALDCVPPPFTYAKDIWGFYNADNTRGFNDEAIDITTPISWANSDQVKGTCFLRNGQTSPIINPKNGYAKNGLLRQIIYPTGGTLTYEYIQNRGKLSPSTTETEVGGVHVSKTTTTDGGYANNCVPANAITTNYNFKVSGSTESSLWGLEMPRNEVISDSYYNPEYKYYKYVGCFPFGCCEYKYRYPGILSQNQTINLSDIQKFMLVMSPVLNAISIVTSVLDVINLVCYSSGFMAWAAVILDVVGGLVTLVLTCASNQSDTKTTHTYYNTDLNAASPLPSQFKRVEVEDVGNIGRTVHEFTDQGDYDYTILWSHTNPNLAAKQRFPAWAYGLPKKVTIYDKDNLILKETINEYDFFYARQIIKYCSGPEHPGAPCNPSGVQSSLVSCKCVVTKSSSQRDPHWREPETYNPGYQLAASSANMKVEFYGMFSGRVELKKTTDKVYSKANQSNFIQTVTQYSYNSANNYDPYLVSTTQSNGDIINKWIKYTSDFSGGIMTTLNQANIVSLPVTTATMIDKASGPTGLLIQESVTEFVQLANGDIRPIKLLEQRFDKPQASYLLYTGPGSSTSGYKVLQEFTYDVSGNLIGVMDEGNRKVTNIYDYNDKYVIANVVNADPLLDKAAYTSFETDNVYGGWSMTGGGSTYNPSNVTGNRSFNLNGRSFTRLLNTDKDYILSFWANNSNVSVGSGSTLKVSSPTINDFTYYEYAIASGTASISLSGNSIIDELRIYPKMARMRTVTYDPVIGKTSESDENNRITYYEYDNLGRMRFVKDEKKNIVKMYEYNNVSDSKLNGCPGFYSNKLITEKFVRHDCASGFVGDTIPYSIAAGTFTSVISQADADAQAENYLLINGPLQTLTSGSCLQVWKNEVKSENFISESCGPGYVGGTITYTVPAGKYSSVISQADANQYALDEIEANGFAYANNPLYRSCTLSTVPLWEWDGASSYCTNNVPAHLMVYEKDINPNSSTYNTYRWNDVGVSEICPSPTGCVYFSIFVPYSVGTNLYIRVTDCSNTVNLWNWNTQVIYDDIPEQNGKLAHLCLKGDASISFRYGASGSSVSIPEIIITAGAQCP